MQDLLGMLAFVLLIAAQFAACIAARGMHERPKQFRKRAGRPPHTDVSDPRVVLPVQTLRSAR
jgi:hypothetical protein